MARGPLPPLALVYHGVAEVSLGRDPDALFVAPRELRRHIEKLEKWGYRLLSFGELASGVARNGGHGLAALTFDDGFVDNLELLDIGVPATVFVVSGWLGQPHPSASWTRILTADELRELRAAGIEIGAHTVTHPDLSALPYEQAREELAESKRRLEEVLGEPVEVAAYPYGLATEETARACRDAGFRAACVTTGRGDWGDPHLLPRQDMENGATLFSLRLKRDGHYEPLMRFLPARAARRIVRRARAALR